MLTSIRIRCRHAAAATVAAVFAVAAAAPTPAAAQAGNLPAPRDTPYPGTLRLQVDATDLPHHIFRIKETVPVRAGTLMLLFPKFLPGTHGPYGEIDKVAGLTITAAGNARPGPLPWRRDLVEPYAFQVEVPAGVAELDVQFQFLSAVNADSGRVVMTREMLNAQWNSLLLYPAGYNASAIAVQASLRLPPGWRQASALALAGAPSANNTISYQPTSLETLVDSPVFAGAHLRRVELDPPGTPNPVVLNLVADDALQLEASDEQLQAHRNLVTQADRLFGARHYRHYDLLLALSEHLGRIGLEHHESSENGVLPSYFKDWAKRPGPRDLLPHEYVHSWNGKFRRPADLLTPDFEQPMRNTLLWVYEGQTDFWGRVLAARSGLINAEQTRDNLANVAASLDARAGRAWRNLQDTTNEGTLGARGRGKDWANWERGADYYAEATLIWLDADTLIRELSGNQRSLDDFARAFFGVQPGRVQPLPYTFDDVVAALNQVQPHDWRSFLRTRLDSNGPGAPLDGLARAGWKLAWAETPSEFAKNNDVPGRDDDFAYSLGIYVKREGGGITGVLWDSPAFRAGMTRGAQLVAVNGVVYKAERLSAAITANKTGQAPLDLLVKDNDRYSTLRLDYRGGLRYPRLERVAGTPERLDAGVLAPRP